ncbi:hypothetical protein Tco_0144527 [Tanacetum coccineum]
MSTSATHNAIMEVGGKDHVLMLVARSYVQWKSRIRRYITTRLNHELINEYIKNGPYEYKWVNYPKVLPANGNPGRQPKSKLETYSIVNDEIKKRVDAEVKEVHIILIGIDNDIYSTVDAYANAKEMWIVIVRLMQGENINKQDMETNLKRKEIARAPSPPHESEHEVVSDEDDTPRDKEIPKLMALISTSFKNIYNLATTTS